MSAAPLLAMLQGEPRHALVLAMLLSYALGFAGMILAYVAYRRRMRSGKQKKEEERPS